MQMTVFYELGKFALLSLTVVITFSTTQARCPQKPCCSMTKEELNSCRGLNSECPSQTFYALIDITTCKKCPVGQCRLGGRCICPDAFINWPARHGSCSDSFGKSWPLSIGRPDLDRQKCWTTEAQKAKCKRKSCCSMTKEELLQCRGLSSNCPITGTVISSHLSRIDEKSCQECPVGECRHDGYCYCPGAFLSWPAAQGACRKAHGKSWPLSADRPDLDRQRCKKESSPTSGNKNAAPSEASKRNQENPGKTNSHSPQPVVPNNTGNKDSGGRTSVPPTDSKKIERNKESKKEEDKGKKLTRAELLGAIFGGVGALAAVAGVIVAIFKKDAIVAQIQLLREHQKHPNK